jgi:hypothetical protein
MYCAYQLVLLLQFEAMRLLREPSQTPVETPGPAAKAGPARFRLFIIVTPIRRM